jgi:hypothetical protein
MTLAVLVSAVALKPNDNKAAAKNNVFMLISFKRF